MTGGGDCPGLNAVIRAVVYKAHALGWRVMGIKDATEGLIDLEHCSPRGNRWLTPADVDGILTRGGTILGTSNRADPFRYVVQDGDRARETDVSDRCVANAAALGLDALISVGGDGSMRIAKRLADKGMNIVGVPKTIDQDLAATDYTFGFSTAVESATEGLDRLQDTAASHDRVMVLEVMGRDAGWIALYTAIAGGAHICLLPEIPYRIEPVVAAIKARRAQGRPYSIIVIAEGARPRDGDAALLGPAKLGEMPRFFGAGHRLGAQLEPLVQSEVRVTVLGHIQRGGSPTHFDRILGTRFGVEAVNAIADGDFGTMVALRTPEIVRVDLSEACENQRLVDPGGAMIAAARDVGIVLGD
ncbi:MAG: ATP-dependent 6-phosphofructokinase [Myxococcota bacterium]